MSPTYVALAERDYIMVRRILPLKQSCGDLRNVYGAKK